MRGVAGRCAFGTKLPAYGPCPSCGVGPGSECPKARIAESEELERLRKGLPPIHGGLELLRLAIRSGDPLGELEARVNELISASNALQRGHQQSTSTSKGE